jgi:hypothetical protein
MADVEPASAQEDHQYHYYVGSKIPWYVHLIWILFWIMAIAYAIRWLIPALGSELLSPP